MPRPRTYGTLYHLLAARPVGPCAFMAERPVYAKSAPTSAIRPASFRVMASGTLNLCVSGWVGSLRYNRTFCADRVRLAFLVDKAAFAPPSVRQSFARSFAPAAIWDLDSAKRPAHAARFRGTKKGHQDVKPDGLSVSWSREANDSVSNCSMQFSFPSPVSPPTRAFT